MGRTVRPVRHEIDAQLMELRDYVKSLRAEDRIYFEKMLADVKKHVSSMSYASPLNPNELMQWSVILELEKKVTRLNNELDRYLRDR